MLNQCNFIGRVGKDAELRYTPDGTAVATFSVACSEKWKDKNGEQKEKTEWVPLVAWRGLAEICGKFVVKGMLVFVSGKLQTRSYDDKDGVKRYVTEIVIDEMKMLSKPEGASSGEQRETRRQPPQSTGGGGFHDAPFNPDDDIPFFHGYDRLEAMLKRPAR